MRTTARPAFSPLDEFRSIAAEFAPDLVQSVHNRHCKPVSHAFVVWGGISRFLASLHGSSKYAANDLTLDFTYFAIILSQSLSVKVGRIVGGIVQTLGAREVYCVSYNRDMIHTTQNGAAVPLNFISS